MEMRKRNTALLLCVSIFFSMVIHLIPGAFASQKSAHILLDGKQVSEITIEQNEKEILTAKTKGLDVTSYQWQILLDPQNAIWVNIYDKTEQECEISYAVVKNLLDGADSTYIRYAAICDDETVYSDAVCLSVTLLEAEPAQITSFDQPVYTNAKTVSKKAKPITYGLSKNSESEYVTITVKYLDISSLAGEEAAIYSPYTATIEKGSNFNQTVVSPTFLGFAPYYDADNDGEIDDDAAMISLSLSSVSEDMEYKVYYKPIKVNFAIRYFFQNINDDLYTENASLYHTSKAETGTIISDEYLNAWAGNTDGFEKMYHIPESVAADGSTVFECYYDRNYYLLQFDLAGGYGVDPIYARYGTPFVVNTPIRHGYNFKGWDLAFIDTNGDGVADKGDGEADELPSTIPEKSQYYVALWESVNTTYTIAYWSMRENGNEYLGARQVTADSGNYVDGTDDLEAEYKNIFRYEEHIHSEEAGCYGNCKNLNDWNHQHTSDCLSCKKLEHIHTDDCNANPRYYEFVKADKNVLVDGDGSAIVNVYYRPKEYTLRFYYARSTGEGDNTKYSVVGGSTWPFGGCNLSSTVAENYSVDDLLKEVPEGNWGEVAELPKWYTNTQLSGSTSDISQYELGSREVGNYTYYYFDFKARYGEDISSKWPIGILSPVKTMEKHNHTYTYTDENGKTITTTISKDDDYSYAYFSAWNGEYKVKYTQDNLKGNQTIKGRYMKLDETVLYDNKFEDSDVVSYLGFWDNGANISWSVPKLFRYHLMLEAPDGTATEYQYDGKYYTLFQEFRTFDDSVVSSQTPTSIDGFDYKYLEWKRVTDGYTSVMGEKLRDAYDVYFYYERKDYTITYFNYENVLNSVTVPYDTLFSTASYYKEPDYYPPSLEPNAYEFVGWYTSPGRIAGTEVQFDKDKMPAEDVVWYAKWVPKKHTVNFFTAYDEMLSYESGDTSVKAYKTYGDVTHSTVVGMVETPPSNDLVFAGWFYIENGQKKAFVPSNMPITRDMNIFADWSSKKPQPYHIEYVLLGDPSVKVANDTTGFAYQGATRTFTAKAGNPYNQLYEEYNSGYFPTVGSHSITMQEDDQSNPTKNIYTFYYVEAKNIEYTVRYINRETNIVMDEVTMNTSNSVVTERFEAYPNMVPDAFYKRLVISVEWDEEKNAYVGTEDNVITFYYTPNTDNAYYAVHFMLEKLGASDDEKQDFAIDGSGGYEETGTHMEGIGDIGKSVSVAPQTFSGFKLIEDEAKSVVNGLTTKEPYKNGSYNITISQDGTELYIFYERLNYDYTVHYYLYNTTEKLSDDKNITAPYDSTVTEEKIDIPGYTCISAQTQTISIRENKDQNVITFYYSPVQYVVEYVAVPDNGGRLSKTIEVISGGDELFDGSVPTANQNYEFLGWYLDEECTQSALEYGSVDEATNCFVPDKNKLSESDSNIFYAKFIQKTGNLTIVRENAEDEGQVFVYEVKNNATSEVINITIVGNNSVTIYDLPFGDYTVTQQNDWSWRYNDEGQTVNHQNDGTTVEFNKNAATEQWLNGNSDRIQNQRRQR